MRTLLLLPMLAHGAVAPPSVGVEIRCDPPATSAWVALTRTADGYRLARDPDEGPVVWVRGLPDDSERAVRSAWNPPGALGAEPFEVSSPVAVWSLAASGGGVVVSRLDLRTAERREQALSAEVGVHLAWAGDLDGDDELDLLLERGERRTLLLSGAAGADALLAVAAIDAGASALPIGP